MRQVYVKMFLALLVTALVSLGINILGSGFMVFIASNPLVYIGLFVIELIMVIYLSARIDRMSALRATSLFYLYAIINGIVLSIIFAIYTPVSIFKTFLITAGTFGAMSVYGYFTSSDLTKFGTFLRMALIGLLICLVVSYFWANSTLEWIISAAGVVIFTGLTAYDTQKIRNLSERVPYATNSKIATLGALSLYLDFINLFLYLLRFFGSSRD